MEQHVGWRALSGSDETLRLWDLGTGDTIRTLEGHTGDINSVALSADGTRALSGSDDTTLRLWDLGTGDTIRTLKGHTSWVISSRALPHRRREALSCHTFCPQPPSSPPCR